MKEWHRMIRGSFSIEGFDSIGIVEPGCYKRERCVSRLWCCVSMKSTFFVMSRCGPASAPWSSWTMGVCIVNPFSGYYVEQSSKKTEILSLRIIFPRFSKTVSWFRRGSVLRIRINCRGVKWTCTMYDTRYSWTTWYRVQSAEWRSARSHCRSVSVVSTVFCTNNEALQYNSTLIVTNEHGSLNWTQRLRSVIRTKLYDV